MRTDGRSEPNKAYRMVRVVIDTNVLVSALINGGKPKKLLGKLLKEHTLIMSPVTTAELADVLSRDKFIVKRAQVDKFVLEIVGKSKMVPTTRPFKGISRDPDDDAIINTAFRGKAEYVVTGDKDLLALGAFKKIQIVSVNQMLEILK